MWWMVALSSCLAPPPTAAAAESVFAQAEDVSARFVAWNSREDRRPPTSFSSGQVSPRKLSPKRVRTASRSFRVRLPSGTPIVSPTVHRGVVLASGGFGSAEIYAFDADTGESRWGLALSDDGPSTFACKDGVCAFATESCTLFAVEVETGRHLWSKWLGDPMMSAPTIARGRVYAASPAASRRPHPSASHVLAAFDLETGEIVWQRWIDADVTSAPVAVDGELFVTTFAGTVLRLRQEDGEILAARAARATSAPVVVGDDVYFSQRADEIVGGVAEAVAYAGRAGTTKSVGLTKLAPYLDVTVQRGSALATEGAVLDAGNGFGGGPPPTANAAVALATVGQGTVSKLQSWQGSRVLVMAGSTVVTMGDEVVSTDRDGQVRWRTKLPGDLRRVGGALGTPPAAAGGRVWVGTVAGEVLEIDPEDGRIVRAFVIGAPVRSQPVIAGGWLYVGTERGELVGIDTLDTEADGWSHWGGDAARTGISRD